MIVFMALAGMPLPKYHQVYLVLKERLLEGDFADGLPGELTLMPSFGVSRVTVRKALELLASEGLVTRQAGRGTRPAPGVVAAPASDEPRAARSGLLDNLVSISLGTRIKVLELITVKASVAVADALAIDVGAQVQKAVRVRSVESSPKLSQ